MENKTSRRSFLATTATAAAAVTILPSNVVSGMGYKAPSDKLNIAGIGVGGMGFGNLKNLRSENIVGLCDVDWKYADGCFKEFPGAKKYKDWRVMYDELGKSIDGVMVATADHTHCITAAHAITMGKAVYVQKPLTHTVYESRLLTKLAAKYNVATQMGNQGSSQEGVNLTCEWLANGEIGEVTKVEAFTDRPIWPQGLNTPKQGQWVPETLDWDLFTGPAAMRPYNEIYHPWNWRGWWAYGTGALGDMACHILHPVFTGLELGYPTKAQGNSTLLLQDCAPSAQSVKLTFPARAPKRAWKGSKKGAQLPAVEVFWYDGGMKPFAPAELEEDGLDVDAEGMMLVGDKGKILAGFLGEKPRLIPAQKAKEYPVFTAPEKEEDEMRSKDWVEAIKTGKESPGSFLYAGPLTETINLASVALRTGKKVDYDSKTMSITNLPDANKYLTREYRKGWEV